LASGAGDAASADFVAFAAISGCRGVPVAPRLQDIVYRAGVEMVVSYRGDEGRKEVDRRPFAHYIQPAIAICRWSENCGASGSLSRLICLQTG